MTTKNRVWRRSLLIALCFCAVLAVAFLFGGRVQAAEIVQSGKVGDSDCPYTIDSDGVVTIGDGGDYSLPNGKIRKERNGEEYIEPISWPWHKNGLTIAKIVINGKITAGNTLKEIFSGKYTYLEEIQGIENLKTDNTIDFSRTFVMYRAKNSTLDLSTWNTSNAKDMSDMFDGCNSIKHIKFGKYWNTSNVTNMESIFYNCCSLTDLDIGKWDVSKVTDMSAAFHNCQSLTKLDINQWNTENVTDMSAIFQDCTALESLNIRDWDTSKVEKIVNIFEGCHSLKNLDVSNWNTSAVTNMDGAFSECEKLIKLNLNRWNTKNVTDMIGLFQDCTALESLSVSDWDISNVKDMSIMFDQCYSLKKLDVSNWNTSAVTDMWAMFAGCSSLKNLDVSKWDTSNVEQHGMNAMFADCSSLSTLNLSGWVTNKYNPTNERMFENCKLKKIKLGANFYFKKYFTNETAELPDTHKWQLEGSTTNPIYTAAEMMEQNPQKEAPGWYVDPELNNPGTGETSNFHFSRELPILSESKSEDEREKMAKAFVCFVFNKSEKKVTEIPNSEDYIKLMTGKFEGSDDQKYMLAVSLLEVINSNIESHDKEGAANKEKLEDSLVTYLQKRAGTDNPSDAEVQKVYHGIVDYTKKIVVSYLEDSGSSKAQTVAASFEGLSNAKATYSNIKNLMGDLTATVEGAELILNSEYTGRYSYFNSYISLREQFDKDSPEFQTLKSANAFVAKDNNILATLINFLLPGKTAWYNKIELIDEWAEYTYQLQSCINDLDATAAPTATYQNYTRNMINCPVDVTVKDENGGIIAVIKDNKITQPVSEANQDKVYVAVFDDSKEVAVNNGVKCKIEITATDQGTMDYLSVLVKNSKDEIINNTNNVSL